MESKEISAYQNIVKDKMAYYMSMRTLSGH